MLLHFAIPLLVQAWAEVMMCGTTNLHQAAVPSMHGVNMVLFRSKYDDIWCRLAKAVQEEREQRC